MNYEALDEAFNAEMEAQERFRRLCPNSAHDKVNLRDLRTLLSQREKWLALLSAPTYEAKTQALARSILGEE